MDVLPGHTLTLCGPHAAFEACLGTVVQHGRKYQQAAVFGVVVLHVWRVCPLGFSVEWAP